MNVPTKAKLEAKLKEHPNDRTIMAWLKYQERELSYKLKKTTTTDDFRFTQGQLLVLDDLILRHTKDTP